jgi:hypothetical protein
MSCRVEPPGANAGRPTGLGRGSGSFTG